MQKKTRSEASHQKSKLCFLTQSLVSCFKLCYAQIFSGK
jgi:hypothetical protein